MNKESTEDIIKQDRHRETAEHRDGEKMGFYKTELDRQNQIC